MKKILLLIIFFLGAYIMLGLEWDEKDIKPMEIITPLIVFFGAVYFIIISLDENDYV